MSDRLLVVVAHPDDECLLAGGTMAKYVALGGVVKVLILADGVSSRGEVPNELARRRFAANCAAVQLGSSMPEMLDYPDNRMDQQAMLHVAKDIETRIRVFKPQTVITHHGSDCNIDHRIVSDAVAVACRPQPGQSVERVLLGEVPSSTEYQFGRPAFHPNYFVDISAHVREKMSAIEQYGDELRQFPHPRSLVAIGNLAAWRGASVGVAAAEAFVAARIVA